MNLLDRIAGVVRSSSLMASDEAISLEDWISMFQLGSMPLGFGGSLAQDREEVEQNFAGLVEYAYRANGVVFACAMTRFLLFSQARILFQQMRDSQPGDLFGTRALGLVEHPWPGGTTADLLASVDLDAQFAGSGYTLRHPAGRYERLRPDYVGIVYGSRDGGELHPWDPDAELLGYSFHPDGLYGDAEPKFYLPDEVAIYAPVRDPLFRFRGMSWLRPVLREIMGDTAAMKHKQAFFENGATPSTVVKSEIRDTKKWREWVEAFREKHEGAAAAYRTIHLQSGADVQVVGTPLRQLSFKEVQGHGETRIAAASGMHPVIVPLTEGLQGASLNAGNFREAAKAVGDTKLRSFWAEFCSSFESILPPPAPSTRVWYDDRHIPFLGESLKDAAEVQSSKVADIRTLTDGGYTPASVIDAVTSGDLRRLQHAGYLPVQVQPIQGGESAAPAAALAYQPIPGFATQPLELGLPKAVGPRRAVVDFWPASGLLEQYGPINRGTVLDASSPHVQQFPALFTSVEPKAGPQPLSSREEIVATRSRLRSEGRPYGYEAVARELHLSASTVRRRLTGN